MSAKSRRKFVIGLAIIIVPQVALSAALWHFGLLTYSIAAGVACAGSAVLVTTVYGLRVIFGRN